MKRICLFLIAFTLLLAGCNSNKVKVRGKVIGLQGTVKLLAEMPGQQGLVILAQQDVTDGNIDLETEALQIPARVWVDVAGKNTLEFILDSKDQIWIQGKIKFPDQIEVKGSGLDMEYAKLKKMFKEKYEGPIEPIDKNTHPGSRHENRDLRHESDRCQQEHRTRQPVHQPTHRDLLHPRPEQGDTLSPEIKTEIIVFQGSENLTKRPGVIRQ